MRSRASFTALLAAAVLLGGCGTQTHSAKLTSGQINAAFKGSPAPLAALHSQADQLLGGGTRAFEARLAALRGYPVVVNEWAEWCEPCQSEFPTYQRAGVAYGRRVAFLGLDAKDTNTAAAAFLKRFPVTYPSYTDPHGSIASAIHAFTAYPQTFYFNRQGKMVYDKAGPYLTVAALEHDIRRYALGAT